MLRTALAAARMGLGYIIGGIATAVIATAAIVLTWINPRLRLIDWLVRAWGRFMVFWGAVRTDLIGAEHLDPNGSYMLVSNHQSAIDPPLHLARLPVPVRFLAKAELFRVPIFGPAMRAVGMVETDRSAGVAGHRAINREVSRVMDLKKSIIVYPEGTRTADGELRPFKKGAFRIAIDNDLPLVPLTLHRAFTVWPPGSRISRGGRVVIVIHEPIPTTDLDHNDLNDLRDQARDIIDGTLQRLRREDP